MKQRNKRRKLSIPPHNLHEAESLDLVPSPIGPISTSFLSEQSKQVLLERLKIEVVEKFEFSLSKRDVVHLTDENQTRVGSGEIRNHPSKDRAIDFDICTFLRQSIIVGTNQCTRALEQTLETPEKKPSILLLCRDIRPPTMLAHIPLMCQRLKIPILLLPGRASFDLGQTLGIKTASVMLFFKKTKDSKNISKAELNFHKLYDSFLNFALSKVPKESNIK